MQNEQRGEINAERTERGRKQKNREGKICDIAQLTKLVGRHVTEIEPTSGREYTITLIFMYKCCAYFYLDRLLLTDFRKQTSHIYD